MASQGFMASDHGLVAGSSAVFMVIKPHDEKRKSYYKGTLMKTILGNTRK